MRIERFNESNNEYNLNSFKKFAAENSRILSVIYKYLEWKRDCGQIDKDVWFQRIKFYFRNDDLIIDFYDDFGGSSNTYYITNTKDMYEFLRFVNDPDIFISSKKYNI